MFICARCRFVQPPRTPQHHIVTETRPKVYVNYNFDGEQVTSKGYETVTEIACCAECAEELEAAMPAKSKPHSIMGLSVQRRLELLRMLGEVNIN